MGVLDSVVENGWGRQIKYICLYDMLRDVNISMVVVCDASDTIEYR